MTTRAVAGRSEESIQRMRTVIERFRAVSRESFLAQYREPPARRSTLARTAADAALIDLFVMEKAAYEVCLRNRQPPRLADRAAARLAEIAERLAKREEGRHAR